MKNIISCLIHPNDIDILKMLKECGNVDLHTLPTDGKTATFKISANGTEYFIVNTPTEQLDGDEYPLLGITNSIDYSFDGGFKVENVKITGINLIRDDLRWEREGGYWNVTVDVGIKIQTNKGEVLLLALDSVAGLLLFAVGESIMLPRTETELMEHWVYKTDSFTYATRQEITIL